MMDDGLISTGELARRVGISVSMVRKLEKIGAIPPADRLLGSDRRVYRGDDVTVVREAIEKRGRAKLVGVALDTV